MKLENVKRSIIIKSYKLTAKMIKNYHIVFIGTMEQCETFANSLDNDNTSDDIVISCLGDYQIKKDSLIFRGNCPSIKALSNIFFVQYWA